ncbi:hypothetical protein UPYG_G00057660 [Umbra pygmaea]|uniref:Uncharacterized protein n=1 Tax=Umbra pygmaea TaxID=75934 RepID=A0ABD0X8L5_UMBPY
MSSVNSPPAKEQVCWTEEQGLWLNIVVKEEDDEVTVCTGEEGAATVIEDESGFRVKEEQVPVKDEDIHFTLRRENVNEEGNSGDLINTSEIHVYPGCSGEPQQHPGSDKDNSSSAFPECLDGVSVSSPLLLGLKRLSVTLVDCRKTLSLSGTMTEGQEHLMHQREFCSVG